MGAVLEEVREGRKRHGGEGNEQKGMWGGEKRQREGKGNWKKVACGVLRGTNLLHSQLLNSLYLG